MSGGHACFENAARLHLRRSHEFADGEVDDRAHGDALRERGEFIQANPAFDPASLRTITLIFDRAREGAVVLDDVGFDGEGWAAKVLPDRRDEG